jgi:hypothetical protein
MVIDPIDEKPKEEKFSITVKNDHREYVFTFTEGSPNGEILGALKQMNEWVENSIAARQKALEEKETLENIN